MGAYEDSVEAWRAARYRRLTAPDGWLALIGKFPLELGTSKVESAREGGRPVVVGVTRDASRVVVELAPGVARELGPAGIQHGPIKLELLRRGDEASLRVKDQESPARTGFHGIPHYPVEPRWRIVTRLVPFTDERSIELDYEGGVSTSYRGAGVAVFHVGGEEQRLTLLHDTDQPRLYVLFKDGTSRDATYGAGRFMYTPLPVKGEVTLDFNQAFNPPCALTPWASCPLVPRENWLLARIEAGEKVPEEH